MSEQTRQWRQSAIPTEAESSRALPPEPDVAVAAIIFRRLEVPPLDQLGGDRLCRTLLAVTASCAVTWFEAGGAGAMTWESYVRDLARILTADLARVKRSNMEEEDDG